MLLEHSFHKSAAVTWLAPLLLFKGFHFHPTFNFNFTFSLLLTRCGPHFTNFTFAPTFTFNALWIVFFWQVSSWDLHFIFFTNFTYNSRFTHIALFLGGNSLWASFCERLSCLDHLFDWQMACQIHDTALFIWKLSLSRIVVHLKLSLSWIVVHLKFSLSWIVVRKEWFVNFLLTSPFVSWVLSSICLCFVFQHY